MSLASRQHQDEFLVRDTIHSLSATLAACILSGGLVYLLYLIRVATTAHGAGLQRSSGGWLLLFGKRLIGGEPDQDFLKRIERVHTQLQGDEHCQAILLGGGPPGAEEACAARRVLLARNPDYSPRLKLESQSINTLENLRNARAMLAAEGIQRVQLISNRYHLARCGQFARQLSIQFELCPAEDRMSWNVQTGILLMREAFCLCWLDIGTRWAKLIGHRRMVNRVS